METRLYLNLIPESLVASNLSPEEFGSYMAVGTKSYCRGEAIFFEVDPGFDGSGFPDRKFDEGKGAENEPGSKPGAAPKHSAYLATYRVLERVPVDQLGPLYLTTDDGRVLKLERGDYVAEPERELNLYQEFCPASPRVASRLAPPEFIKAITDPGAAISFPRVVFADLILNALAADPLGGDIGDLPYRELDHLRACLQSLRGPGSKAAKNVSRRLSGPVHYRTVRRGFYVGDRGVSAFYPMPSRAQLESVHHEWWRSAQTISE